MVVEEPVRSPTRTRRADEDAVIRPCAVWGDRRRCSQQGVLVEMDRSMLLVVVKVDKGEGMKCREAVMFFVVVWALWAHGSPWHGSSSAAGGGITLAALVNYYGDC